MFAKDEQSRYSAAWESDSTPAWGSAWGSSSEYKKWGGTPSWDTKSWSSVRDAVTSDQAEGTNWKSGSLTSGVWSIATTGGACTPDLQNGSIANNNVGEEANAKERTSEFSAVSSWSGWGSPNWAARASTTDACTLSELQNDDIANNHVVEANAKERTGDFCTVSSWSGWGSCNWAARTSTTDAGNNWSADAQHHSGSKYYSWAAAKATTEDHDTRWAMSHSAVWGSNNWNGGSSWGAWGSPSVAVDGTAARGPSAGETAPDVALSNATSDVTTEGAHKDVIQAPGGSNAAEESSIRDASPREGNSCTQDGSMEATQLQKAISSKVFISGLNLETMPQTLGEHCQTVGEVRYATIYMDPDSKASNGTGKVDFDSEMTAKRAIADLSGSWLDGHQITLQMLCEVAPQPWQRRENDGRSVFFGGLGFDIDEDALWNFAAQCGGVTFVKLFVDHETGRSRGCGKVEFDSVEAAQRAIQELDGTPLRGRAVIVELLGQDSGRRAGQRKKAFEDSDRRSVFVGGLNFDADDVFLRSLTEPVGGVTFAQVFLDRGTGQSRGCGKVVFETTELAQQAIRELHGKELGGRVVTVEPLGLDSSHRSAPRRRAPPGIDGRQVFLRGISPEVDVNSLRWFFQSVGSLTHAAIFTDRETGKPKGTGKVEFETQELAQQAVQELDGKPLQGQQLTLRIMTQEGATPLHRETKGTPVIDGRQVLVGGLSPETSQEKLHHFCETAGMVISAKIFARQKGSGKVEFETIDMAQQAVTDLDGKELDGHNLTLRIMSDAPLPRQAAGPRGPPAADGRQVFFGRLSPDTDAEALRVLCEPFGPVTFATVFTNRETELSKCAGKVEFGTREQAQAAAKDLDGKVLDGREIRVHVMDNTQPPGRSLQDPDAQGATEPGCKLFIGSLPEEFASDQLKELMQQAGEVRFARVFTTSAGIAGTAVMASAEEAQRAISVLNDTFLLGRRIVVKLDTPPSERAPKPNLDSVVFVGGLSFDTSKMMLEKHFSQAGDILYAGIFTDRESGRSRGSGKIEFSSPAAARQAVQALNDSELDGRRLQVKLMEEKPPQSAEGGARTAPEPDGRQLFFGALSHETTGDSLKQLCEERIGSVRYAIIFSDRETGKSKGAGKVEFETLEVANHALEELNGAELDGRAIVVRRMGEERRGNNTRIPPDGRTVFFRGLSWDVGSEDLKIFASQVGEVTFANVFVDRESGKSKGAGKVQFASVELAQQAVAELSGRELYGREVFVRIMDAEPRHAATEQGTMPAQGI